MVEAVIGGVLGGATMALSAWLLRFIRLQARGPLRMPATRFAIISDSGELLKATNIVNEAKANLKPNSTLWHNKGRG